MFSKKVTLVLTAVTLICVGLMIVVNFTEACRLKEVTLNDHPINNWSERYGLQDSKSVLGQPVDSLAQSLLTKKDIFKVDIDYSLPSEIKIKTNNFRLSCFVLDRISGRLWGVSEQGRLISLENCEYDWEHPVLTSIETGKAFQYCADVRTKVVVEQLERLREDNVDLYRLIDEVDFGNAGFLRVTIAGLPYRLKVRAEGIYDDLTKFVDFVSKFSPQLDSVKVVDLRFNEMIICDSGKKKNGR